MYTFGRKDQLTAMLEAVHKPDKPGEHFRAKKALAAALYCERLKRQVSVVGVPTHVARLDFADENVRRELENDLFTVEDGRTVVNLVGGTVLRTLHNNLVWFAAASPRQLASNPARERFRGWAFAFDDIQTLSFTPLGKKNEVPVVDTPRPL